MNNDSLLANIVLLMARFERMMQVQEAQLSVIKKTSDNLVIEKARLEEENASLKIKNEQLEKDNASLKTRCEQLENENNTY